MYTVDKNVKYINMYINYKEKHVEGIDKARLCVK